MSETRTEEDWERQLVRMVSEEEYVEPDQTWRACANHAEHEASYQCAGCGRLLCDVCVEEKTIGGEASRFCPECGGACNSLEELKEAEAIASSEGSGKAAKSKAAARPIPPEPVPVDRQLGTVLVFPFRGLGILTILVWVVLTWVAWPLALVALIPFAAQLYARVEEAEERIPAPWQLGGGLGHISRFLAKLTITPVLPLALCYVLLLPGSELPVSAIGDASIAKTVMKAHPAGAGTAAFILLLIPLSIILLLRTGSPFTSLDPLVVWSILRRGIGRYVSLLLSMLVMAAVSFVVFLVLKQTPVGPWAVPVMGRSLSPPFSMVLPGVLGLLWWTVIMALHGRWIGWMLGEESEEGVSRR